MNIVSSAKLNPHIFVLDVILGGIVLVIVVLVVATLLSNAATNIPQLVREPKWLLLLPCVFAIVWVLAFALGASAHLSTILGAVGAGIILLLLLFAS